MLKYSYAELGGLKWPYFFKETLLWQQPILLFLKIPGNRVKINYQSTILIDNRTLLQYTNLCKYGKTEFGIIGNGYTDSSI